MGDRLGTPDAVGFCQFFFPNTNFIAGTQIISHLFIQTFWFVSKIFLDGNPTITTSAAANRLRGNFGISFLIDK